jgi:transposase-like protein
MAGGRRSREQWRRLVEGWAQSGLTQQAYCDRHGISLGSLYRWRAIVREDDAGGGPTEPLRLVPVELIGERREEAKGLTLVLADGVRIEIGADFDAATLRRVLGVLREAA